MKFRKKPIVIEAEQYDGTKEGAERLKLTNRMPDDCTWAEPKMCLIETLEGTHQCSPMDWVITGIKGERYACKPDIFEATYEAVLEG